MDMHEALRHVRNQALKTKDTRSRPEAMCLVNDLIMAIDYQNHYVIKTLTTTQPSQESKKLALENAIFYVKEHPAVHHSLSTLEFMLEEIKGSENA